MTSQRIYRLSRYGNLLLLQAAAGGGDGSFRRVRLLVDTESSYTILPVEVVEYLDCDLQNPLDRIRIPTGGGIITAPVVILPWFNCLGQFVENFPIFAYTLPATTFTDGLLGMNFLIRCHAVISVAEAEIRCPQST